MKVQTEERTSGSLVRLLNEARLEADCLRKRLETTERTLLSTRLIMGHELKRPTTAIRGYLDLALDGFGPDARGAVVDAIKKAQKECRLLEELSSFFLELLKTEGKEVGAGGEIVEVDRCLDEALYQLPECLDAKSRVVVHISPEGAKFRSSPDAIKTVLANVVENALLYSESGAPVDVSFERARDKRGTGSGDLLKVRVTDRGRGIPDHLLRNVFKPFVRLHEEVAKGVGLGLTLVRSLVELHGGSVHIESEEGRGTTVYVTIPETPDPDGGAVLS